MPFNDGWQTLCARRGEAVALRARIHSRVRGFGSAILAALTFWLVAGAAVAQQNRPWPDPTANDVLPYATTGMSIGPVVGRPTATSMRVWLRTLEPRTFRIVYDTKTPLSDRSPSVEAQTLADDDNTGFVDLTQLSPDTQYYYGVMIDGVLADTRVDFDDPFPSFRTLPDATSYRDSLGNPDGRFNLCFSVSHCQSQQALLSGGHYADPPAYRSLHEQYGDEVMFHLVNGDLIYEELRDGTLEGVRANHRVYYDRGRSMNRFLRYTPAVMLYNDHDVGSNLFGAGEPGYGNPGQRLARDPSLRAWAEYAGWSGYGGVQRAPIRFGHAQVREGGDLLYDPDADFSDLARDTVSTIHVTGGPRNAGVYALVDVVDKHRLRVSPALRADERCAYSIGAHQYFDWRVGNCHFFALDTRGERSKFNEADVHDPTRFLLGEAQHRWLVDGVTNTDAEFIFVISPDPWMVLHTAYHIQGEAGLGSKGDGFDGYVHEREQLLGIFDRLAKPVMIFTGDVHNSFAIQISDNVWEFMCGPMSSTNHPIGVAGLPPYGGWFDSQGHRVKIKWVAGFPDNVHYSRLRSTFYGVVQVNNVFKSARPDGVGLQWTAYDSPQVVVRFHDGYTGKLVYAEGISMVDVGRPEATDHETDE